MTSTGNDAPTSEPPAPPAEPAAQPAAEPAPPARPSFWQRPYVERYLTPFVLPLAVVVGIVVYVLNISRIFLASHGHTAVVAGTVITVSILLGATLLALAPRLHTSSLALIAGGFVALIVLGGSVTIGHSQEKKVAALPTLPAQGPASGSFSFEASDALKFTPDSATTQTGVYKITLADVGHGHTLAFDQPDTQWAELVVNAPGDSKSGRIFFPHAGTYTFFCSVPGHRAAGMQGTVTVTGPAVTLAQAEAAAKGGGSGGGPTTTAP